LKRVVKTQVSTIGELYINGIFECYILEDVDRELNQRMGVDEILQLKIKGKTAIPSGNYDIAITWSNRFAKYLPLVMSVPGYAGIRIHPGNTAEHTEGCLLPGEFMSKDRVINSKKAFNKLFKKLRDVERKEKILIIIE
jgi:hypothetical protein